METNFKNNLFEKQINLKDSCVSGGYQETGTTSSECTDGGSDSRTTQRDENGNITQSCFTWE